jgi:hypothetical protein
MLKKIQSLFLIIIIFTVATACKKSELTKFELGDMIYIYKETYNAKKDSALCSFAVKPNSMIVDTVKIAVRIMGVAKNYDREVKLEAVDTATTAVAGVHYQFLPYVIKAGAYNADLPVVINRTPEMKTQGFTLTVKISESKDFKPGVPNSAVAGNFAGASVRYFIRMNDFLTKPSNWDSQLNTYFGAYSQVKFKFIIDVTGITEFTVGQPPAMAFGEINYYKAFVKSKLFDYVALNGPLMDENGGVVTFPN